MLKIRITYNHERPEELESAIKKLGVWNYNCGLIRKRTLTSEYKIYYFK